MPVSLALAFAAIAVAFLLSLWAVQRRTHDAATADVGWTVLVAAGAIVAALIADTLPARRALVALLAAAASLRLGAYLLRDRVLSGRGEDGRYQALRARWGAHAQRNFLFLYLAQGVFAFLFLIPIRAAMRDGWLDAWDLAGALLWLVAIAGESAADRQLAAFRADPANRGGVCRAGLWRYSRHPNYFFEWLQWWAYVLIGRGAPLTVLGPVMMFLFLWFITGIPYTERQALRSRGDRYREYQRTTSAFFPWPPRAE